MIRKNPCYDTMTPAGQIIDRTRLTTWERPLTGKETPEEAYARGWADALAKFEADQKKNEFCKKNSLAFDVKGYVS